MKITKAKSGHERIIASKSKVNLKMFYQYNKRKRITKERAVEVWMVFWRLRCELQHAFREASGSGDPALAELIKYLLKVPTHNFNYTTLINILHVGHGRNVELFQGADKLHQIYLIVIFLDSSTVAKLSDWLSDIHLRLSQSFQKLGATFEHEMSFQSHIHVIAMTSYFHLSNIAQLRSCLSSSAAEALIHASITSRLDYSNALLAGLPHSSFCKLEWSQRVGEDSWNLRTIDWNVTRMSQNLRRIDWNITTMGRSFSWDLHILSTDYDSLSLQSRIHYALMIMQYIYYPILAIVGVPANLVTMGILSQGKCGLSKCVTRYLVAMSVADLLVVFLDLILRHIPIVYAEQFIFLESIPVCNIHAVLLYAATDCSVWFTVTFTFDRFMAICCQKLKSKYCTEKTAAIVLGTVTVLSCLKNIFWYFMFTGLYWLANIPWFCGVTWDVRFSPVWGTIESLHHILTPCVAFVVILLLNVFTIKHILVSSRARRRLRAHSSGESRRDPEMESRRKSIILLLVISANFILLWTLFMAYSLWSRMWELGYKSVFLPVYLLEMGFMLQLLSCSTNTAIYAVTQTQFREQLKNVLKYPFTPIVKFIQ
ncbi:G-protein coupled receptor 39-like [Heterodontus francisci]|uniref:G-protein coupled receptor 39-like n=1 Tax=Heterodontus francisci TaxID=7792 RepID=UPI00355BCB99